LGAVYGAERHVCASDGELGCGVSLLKTLDNRGICQGNPSQEKSEIEKSREHSER
jgi:hypothetical protein